MVKAVVYEARGGGVRFTAGPRALLAVSFVGLEDLVADIRTLEYIEIAMPLLRVYIARCHLEKSGVYDDCNE